MMEAFQLANQLSDKTKKLYDFWRSVREAPREVEQIVSELEIIASLADIIRQETASPRPHTQLLDINLKALSQCLRSLTDLQNLMSKYQAGTSSTSRRVQTLKACKIAWNAEKIKNFRAQLKDAKFTLMFARQETLK
jgi:hypothetical protein